MNQNVTSLLSLIETTYQNEINNIIEKQLKPILEENDKQIYQDNITIDRIINYRSNKVINICVILKKDNKHYKSYDLQLNSNGLSYKDDLHRQSDIPLRNYFDNIHFNLINNNNTSVDIYLHHAHITLGKLDIIYDLLRQEIVDVKPNVISSDECLNILKKIIVTDDEVICSEYRCDPIPKKDLSNVKESDEVIRYKINYHHPQVSEYKEGKAMVNLGEVSVIYDTINKRIDKIIPDVVSEESCLTEMINKSIIKIRTYSNDTEGVIKEEYQRRRVR